MGNERTIMGHWSFQTIDEALSRGQVIGGEGPRIAFLSGLFLETPYRENTLVGSAEDREELVVNFEAMDCLTFLEYVEALRRSGNYGSFVDNLKSVRYRGERVSFRDRRHFFTDWGAGEKSGEPGSKLLRDVTGAVGVGASRTVMKTLNRKGDDSLWVPGAPVQDRNVTYVPTEDMGAVELDRLRTGDYLGFYSPEPGLDVSHVGIAIKTPAGIWLRHASSRSGVMKVVDDELAAYLSEKPGIIVLRPLPPAAAQARNP